MCRWSGLKSKNKLPSLFASLVLITGRRICCVIQDLCLLGYETAQTFMVFLRVQTETEQKIENEPRSLFRDERLQAVLLYLLLVSVRGASIMSYLVPARYFHPRCSLGLTLFEYLSLCFTVGSLGNRMQIPVSCGTLCTALAQARPCAVCCL